MFLYWLIIQCFTIIADCCYLFQMSEGQIYARPIHLQNIYIYPLYFLIDKNVNYKWQVVCGFRTRNATYQHLLEQSFPLPDHSVHKVRMRPHAREWVCRGTAWISEYTGPGIKNKYTDLLSPTKSILPFIRN